MANWTGVITNAGTSLLGEWVDEKTLTITSAQAGTGTVPTAGLMAQTALVNPKQTAAIAGGGEIQGGKRISLQVPAAQEAYTLNQFGVYAKVDEGSPVLLALYQNEQGIPIPSLSETPDFLYTFLAGISVSNQGHWEVTISASTGLTWELVGVPNGIAGLDEDGKVPKEQLPEMDAASVAYDNGSSGLVASTVQGALDELVTGLNEGTIAQANATLASTGWTGDTPTQTLSVPGLPANSPAWIGLAVTATAAQRDAARKAALSPTSRAAGSVTITADGAQPATDLPVTVYYVKKAPEGETTMLASIINMFPGGSTLQIPLDAPTALTAKAGNAQVSLTWTDPNDKYATPEGETAQDPDQLVSKWAYTRIVRKVGSQPSGPNDGTTVLESAVRNQYQTEPFVDTGLQNEVTYYYGAFAYNEDGVVSEGAFASADPKAFDPILENNSWETVDDIGSQGIAPSVWEVGDEKNITVGRETMTMVILGFNHVTLVSGGKAPIAFGTKNCMRTLRECNAANVENTPLFKYVTSTIVTQLSKDLQNVIKDVYAYTGYGRANAYVSDISKASCAATAYETKVFGFVSSEVFGAYTQGYSQYPYYATAGNRIKKLSNGVGNVTEWALFELFVYQYMGVTYYGFSTTTTGTRTYRGVSTGNMVAVVFGFCV